MRPLSRTGNYISTRIGRAIADHKLIEDKDKILVAVSGGKDSMALLTLLNERRKWAPVTYELIAMHVQSDFHCAGCVHTKTLKKFFEERKIRHHFAKIRIVDKEKGVSCFWCSWNRRKALFLAAEELGCNKIAFGHHRDDIVETLLLNMLYQGEFAAMNPRQELFKGKITLIRPLCYVNEDALRKFAKESGFPSQMCKCPNSKTSKRRVVKEFLNEVEKDCDHVKQNVFNSMSRVNKEYLQVV